MENKLIYNLRNISLRAGGEYECEAFNKVGQSRSSKLMVNVLREYNFSYFMFWTTIATKVYVCKACGVRNTESRCWSRCQTIISYFYEKGFLAHTWFKSKGIFFESCCHDWHRRWALCSHGCTGRVMERTIAGQSLLREKYWAIENASKIVDHRGSFGKSQTRLEGSWKVKRNLNHK